MFQLHEKAKISQMWGSNAGNICKFWSVWKLSSVHFIYCIFPVKDAVQSVCKQRLCLHFGIQNIEFYSTTLTIYIFMILEYNKLSRDNNQALQEHKMK